MSNASSDSRNIFVESDDDDHFANGYYEHNSNGSADNPLGEAEDNGHDDNEVVIDFDSGVLTVDPVPDTVFEYDFYIDRQTGTYAEDGFTLAWVSEDWWETEGLYYPDSGEPDNLGAPLFDVGSSDDHRSNENSYDFAFGLNYANGNNGLNDGFEFSSASITHDDGYRFSVEEFDIVSVADSSEPGASVYMVGYNVAEGTSILESFISAYSFDGEDWGYSMATYDYNLGRHIWEVADSMSWDDVADTGAFDNLTSARIDVFGNDYLAIDNIELEVIV